MRVCHLCQVLFRFWIQLGAISVQADIWHLQQSTLKSNRLLSQISSPPTLRADDWNIVMQGKDGGKIAHQVFEEQTLITCSSFRGCSSTWVGNCYLKMVFLKWRKKFFMLPLRPGTVQLRRCSFCGTWWNCGTCRIAACILSPCWCITGSCNN